MSELILVFIALLLGLLVWVLCEIGKRVDRMLSHLNQISRTNDAIRTIMERKE